MIKNSPLIITVFLITSPLVSSFLIAGENQAVPKINVIPVNPFIKNPLTIECKVATQNSTFKLSADDINYAFAEPYLTNIRTQYSKSICGYLYYRGGYNNRFFNLNEDINLKTAQVILEKDTINTIVKNWSNKPVPVEPSISEYLILLENALKKSSDLVSNEHPGDQKYFNDQLNLSIHKWENGLRDIEKLDIQTNNSVNQIDLTDITKDKVPKLSQLVINGKPTPINASSIYNAK